MYSLFLGIFLIAFAICDLTDAKILVGNATALAGRKRKAFRRWRGVILLFMALAAGWIWYVERILRMIVNFPEALLVFGLPFVIPLAGLFVLMKVYGVPLFPKS